MRPLQLQVQTVLAALMAVSFGLGTSCQSRPAELRDPGAAPAAAAVSPTTPPGAAGTQFPVRFSVRNPSDERRAATLIQGGFPFARGVLADSHELRLASAGGDPVPMQARNLMHWPDGSVKWAQITAYAGAVDAHAEETFRLELGDRNAKRAGSRAEGRLPAAVRFELEDGTGRTRFISRGGTLIDSGDLAEERVFRGTFEGRRGRIRAAITISRFPGIGATRYRFELKQLVNGGLWKKLTVSVPNERVMVYQGEQMRARVEPAASHQTRVVLIDSEGDWVERGVGRRWEIWGYDADSRAAGRPLRPVPSPRYLLATGVMGRFVIDPPAPWRKTFDTILERVYRKRDANPRNFGWRHYGSFFDREQGLAYYGYLNQEYDPATTLWLAYARTGNMDYFDKAESLSDFFRDLCVSPDGGTYQHRATVHAAYANVINTIAANLRKKITSARGYSPSRSGLITAVEAVFGEKGGRGARKLLAMMPDSTFEAQERALVNITAGSLVRAQQDKFAAKLARASEAQVKNLTLRDLLAAYAESGDLQALGYRDVDEIFTPFFKRYGGSWDDFPAFHVDIHPDPLVRHTGSHSLIEMLVWAYCFTGDEGYRDVAKTFARHQLDVVIPRVMDMFSKEVQTDKLIRSRDIGWPIIGLLALWDLTEHRDPALNREIKDSARALVRLYTKIREKNHEGGIHVGVGLEALCRYHEKTNDPECGRYIVKLARYWGTKQWDRKRKAFNYQNGVSGSADASMTSLALYGLAYACELSPNESLKARVLEANQTLMGQNASDAKRFAQFFRSTPRALAIIADW